MDDLLKSLRESNVFIQGYADELVIIYYFSWQFEYYGLRVAKQSTKDCGQMVAGLTINRARSRIYLTLSGFETANPQAWDKMTPIRLLQIMYFNLGY